MSATIPHYLLFSQATGQEACCNQWRFVLQSANGSQCLDAADAEPDAPRSRLELLAVVRGLEALEQPSRVTLLTRSGYVRRGIRHGLAQWRDRNWQWERFGRLVPIRDHDLWRRVDRALAIHAVECCPWKWDVSPAATDRCASAAESVSLAGPVAHQTPAEPVAHGEAAAATEIEQPIGPALLIVERPQWNHWQAEQRSGIAWRLGRLVQALRSAVWRPTFDRAA